MKFYILKDGCPKDPSLEQQTFTVSLAEAANAEFELNSKVDAKLNDLDLAILKIKEEVENEGS